MDIDIDIYFWMVDRGVFEDDQRNKVDLDRNKVKMFREHSQRLENGVYIGKLLLLLKKSVILKQNRPFSLDPNLSSLKDNVSSSAKQSNWTVVTKELKKFGITIGSDKKQKILEGRVQFIQDILGKLFDFDNGSLSPEPGANHDLNMSEIQYHVERDSLSLNGRLGEGRLPKRNKLDNQSFEVGRKDNSLLLAAAPTKKATLEPIASSQKASMKTLLKTEASSHQQLSYVGSEVKLKAKLSPSKVSIGDIDQTRELADVQTTLEFILNSLSNSLEIQPKQAAGLLANDHKYLVHIATKGMKGGEFGKVYAWYQQVYQHTSTLCKLIDKEKHENAMILNLNILKCGLFSSQLDLAILCSKVLAKLGKEINEAGDELAGLAWDWFVDKGSQPDNSLDNIQVLNLDMIYNSSPIKNAQPANSLPQSGLAAVLQAVKLYQQDFLSSAISLFVQFGKSNYMELFTYQIPQCTGDNRDCTELNHDIFVLIAETSIGKDMLLNSGVLHQWIGNALRQAEFDGHNTVNERMSALSFLQQVWEIKPEIIEEAGDSAQHILTLFKRGCRDRSRVLRVFSCDQMFHLLHLFASSRNSFAPIIYKSLTFMLIEFHTDLDMREQMVKHFTTVFSQIQTVPVAILCEPLIKQIQISDGSSYAMNVFDFDFFMVIIRHKRINIQLAISVMETMFNVGQSDLFYSKSAISIIGTIVERFSRDALLLQNMSTCIKSCLDVIEDQEHQQYQHEKQYTQLQKQKQLNDEQALKGTSNKYAIRKIQEQSQQQINQEKQAFDTAKLSRATRQRLIVNTIKSLIQINNQFVNQDIRMQLLTTYTRIDQAINVKSQAIYYLLKLYKEDIPQMLQYFVTHEIQAVSPRLQSPVAAKEIDQRLGIKHLDESEQDQQSSNNTHSMAQLVPYVGKTMKQDKIQERALKDIEKIKANKLQQSMVKNKEESQRKEKFEQIKILAKKMVEERKLEHGVVPKRSHALKNDGSAQVRIVDVSNIAESDDEQSRRIIDNVTGNDAKSSPNKNQIKQKIELKLFDIRLEEQKDQDAVRFFMKKHVKIMKNLFQKYSNTSVASAVNVQTFQDLQIKTSLISLAEILKMHKDFQISPIRASQDDVKQLIRLINMQILKKSAKASSKSSLAMLDFEGFVEYVVQLAIHLYSFDTDMNPVDYVAKLFDHIKAVAKQTGNNSAKLYDDPSFTVIGDQQMIAELNKRLLKDPNYKLPEGYIKAVEKEVVNSYLLPDFIPIKQSQRVVIELLDTMLFNKFGFHFIEPMSLVKEIAIAKSNIAFSNKDPIAKIQEKSPVRSYMQPKDQSKKSRQNAFDINIKKASVDVGNQSNATLLQSPSKKRGTSQVLTSRITTPRQSVNEILPVLGVELKLEVAKAPIAKRANTLQVAYVLEEILQAAEKGLKSLPKRQLDVKNKIINKAVQSKIQREADDIKMKKDQQLRLEQRKQILKQQIEKMQENKEVKNQVSQEQKKEQEKKLKEQLKKKEEEKRKFFEQAKTEAQTIKEQKMAEIKQKQQEEEQKKKLEQDKLKLDIKAGISQKMSSMQDQFKKVAEERKQKQKQEEEQKKINAEKEKQRKEKMREKLGVSIANKIKSREESLNKSIIVANTSINSGKVSPNNQLSKSPSQANGIINAINKNTTNIKGLPVNIQINGTPTTGINLSGSIAGQNKSIEIPIQGQVVVNKSNNGQPNNTINPITNTQNAGKGTGSTLSTENNNGNASAQNKVAPMLNIKKS